MSSREKNGDNTWLWIAVAYFLLKNKK